MVQQGEKVKMQSAFIKVSVDIRMNVHCAHCSSKVQLFHPWIYLISQIVQYI